MTDRVDSITIVGGGTAGWLAAAFLVTTLNQNREGPRLKVTLIESPNVPIIGVGEATVPGMYNLLRQLKINETEFIRRCNVSFKCGTRLDHWNVGRDGKPLRIVNSFNTPPYLNGYNSVYHYHKYGPLHGANEFVDAMIINGTAIDFAKGPRQIGDPDYEYMIPYTYHMDASLFAKYLKEVVLTRGVEHILDDVEEIEQGENGFITALKLQRQGRHPVDFVIDCTGFKSLLLQQTLKEHYISYEPYLLADRAIPVQIPHDNQTFIEPCTTATGLSAGWGWRVPLYTRVGTGYVYSSKFISEDKAIAELLAHIGNPKIDMELKSIPMRIGRTRRNWVKNCLGIGLSSGFIEPLEATAIFTIEVSCRWFLTYFPGRQIHESLAKRFNEKMDQFYDDVLEYIIMNYYTSNRTDTPFWLAARNDIKVPERLLDNLELWRHNLPCKLDTATNHLFNYWDYLFVLYGKGYFDGLKFPAEAAIDRAEWDQYEQQLAAARNQMLQVLPDHYDLLTAIRNGTAAPSQQAL